MIDITNVKIDIAVIDKSIDFLNVMMNAFSKYIWVVIESTINENATMIKENRDK
tara:strand:+ start:4359 stop:4520 length:162 start_codon:yes stop_codon:yes gene_type:complete